MKLNLSEYDILILILYYLLISFIGFITGKRQKQSKDERTTDFLLAGRRLTLPFFVASLVATWYGNILGIGEFVYRYGLVAWFCFGIVYYLAALFYALLISTKIRNLSSQTIPELIGSKFGKTTELVSSFVMLIITFPSVYVLMVGVFIELFLGFGLLWAIVLGTIVTFIYIGYGGYKSNVWTNSIQFVIMYLGFGVFTYFAFSGIAFDLNKLQSLPKSHTNLFGEVSWQFIVSWFFISLQTFIDPSFYQRCFSVGSTKTARNGILISVILWIIFDFMTIFIGLVGKLTQPEINPLYNYPYLMEKLVPNVFKGIVLVSMLATIISTLESYTFLSSLILGKNIFDYFRLFPKTSIENKVRIGLALTAFFSISLAYLIPSAIDIIYKTSSIAVPSLFFPTLLSFSSKKTLSGKQVNFLIISSAIVTFVFTLVKDFSANTSNPTLLYLISFEPMVFGFIWSSFLFLAMYFLKKLNFTTTILVLFLLTLN